MFWFDPTVFVSLALLFGIAAQFRAMEGSSSLLRVLASVQSRTGMLFAVVAVTCLAAPLVLNDVVVLVLTPVLVAYARDDPVTAAPLIVAETTFANIASSLTPFGNPQNILLWQASGSSTVAFVALTALPLALSGAVAALALLPFARRPATGAKRSGGPLTPMGYLALVAAAVVAGDLLGFPGWASLAAAFFAGFPFTGRRLARVSREFDFRSLAVLWAFIAGVAALAALASPYVSPVASLAASGSQPLSALFIGGASAVIGNVPVTQLVVTLAPVSQQVAGKLAVEAGLAGNLDPVASFANLIALLMVRKEHLPLRRVVALQAAVGLAAFIPALL